MYQLPTFNIVVGVRHASAAGVWGEAEFVVAQLRGVSRRHTVQASGGLAGSQALALCVPAGTDIRVSQNPQLTDLVDIDGFSGACLVQFVYDVAFAFENEYRVAMLVLTDPTTPGVFTRLPGQGETPAA